MVKMNLEKTDVYFANNKSIYHGLNCNVYTMLRPVQYQLGPGIHHPPCQLWSKLRYFSNKPHCEKLYAINSMIHVRTNGGVLEHPSSSQLWKFMKVDFSEKLDVYGGWCLCIDQSWFGFEAPKKTILYIKGINPNEIPSYPLNIVVPPKRVADLHSSRRSDTVINLANYLIQLITIIKNKNNEKTRNLS